MAVIVILAIIAVIATPIITGIIEDSKKSSFERSAEGVVEATKFDIPEKLTEAGYTYEFENGEIDLGENVKVNNAKNLSGTIKYNKDGEVSYAIHNDKWCVVKKNNEVTTSDYTGECVLEVSTVAEAFTYEEVENGISITDYDINKGGVDIVIPSTIDGKTVVAIGESAFQSKVLSTETSMLNKNNIQFMSNKEDNEIASSAPKQGDIRSVVIPSTVKSIGDYAFAYNKISSVTLSNGLETIGGEAFNKNQLTAITIPKSVTSIGEYAFINNNQLTSVVIESAETQIGCKAFAYNNNLASIKIADVDTLIDEIPYVGC